MFVTVLPLVAALFSSSPRRVTPLVGEGRQGGDCTPAELETRKIALNVLVTNAPNRLAPVLTQLKRRNDGCNAILRLELLTQAFAQSENSPNRGDRFAFARDLATTDADTNVRRTAIEILRQDTNDATVRALAQAAADAPAKSSREAALDGLMNMHSPLAQSELRALYPSFTDPGVKARAISVVATNDSSAWQWLLDIAGTEKENMDVRREALGNALSQQAHAPTSPTTKSLTTVYKKLNDPGLRNMVVDVLLQRLDDNAALDQLGDIAKADPENGLRERAIGGLRDAHGDHATKLLSEIVTQ